jgi:hypothetical protein
VFVGNSVARLIASVNAASSSTFLSGGLTAIRSKAAPSYAHAPGSEGLTTQAKLLWGAVAGWFLYRADTQARSKDWIVDLSLDVLQAAWLISYSSFLPFRSIFFSLRSIAPHTSTPLGVLRPAIGLK